MIRIVRFGTFGKVQDLISFILSIQAPFRFTTFRDCRAFLCALQHFGVLNLAQPPQGKLAGSQASILIDKLQTTFFQCFCYEIVNLSIDLLLLPLLEQGS